MVWMLLTTGFCGLTVLGAAFLPCAVSSSDQRSSTSQPMVALGKAARIPVATGRACRMSPIAPSRTIRIFAIPAFSRVFPQQIRSRVVFGIADDGHAAAAGNHDVALGHALRGIVRALGM